MYTQQPIGASAAAQTFFDAYDAHDIDRMLSLCADDAQLRYVPMGKYGEGPVRTAGRRIWSAMIAALPDMSVSVAWFSAGERGVGAEVVIADERRNYRLQHAFLLRFDGSGRITEVIAYWDNVQFAVASAKSLVRMAANAWSAIASAVPRAS